VAGVTLGLAAIGALVGGTAALLAAFAFCLALFGVPTEPPDTFLFGFVAAMGAVLGAVLGPIAGWLGMRRASIGRLVAGASLGTAVGALLGLALGLALPGGVVGGSIVGAGFGGIATGLWLDRRAASRLPDVRHMRTL